MERWNLWLQSNSSLLSWHYSCLCRGGGWGEQTAGGWQSSSGTHLSTSVVSPTRPLWRLEMQCLINGERAADLAAYSEHAHSSGDRNIHLNAAEYNSPFPSHVIVLQMSNTSGILVLVIHSSYHNECHVTFCCSCLVSMTPGWRSTTLWANSMKLNMTRLAINLETWKKISKRHYSKQSVFFPPSNTSAPLFLLK